MVYVRTYVCVCDFGVVDLNHVTVNAHSSKV